MQQVGSQDDSNPWYPPLKVPKSKDPPFKIPPPRLPKPEFPTILPDEAFPGGDLDHVEDWMKDIGKEIGKDFWKKECEPYFRDRFGFPPKSREPKGPRRPKTKPPWVPDFWVPDFDFKPKPKPDRPFEFEWRY